jgi:hypothetical protein
MSGEYLYGISPLFFIVKIKKISQNAYYSTFLCKNLWLFNHNCIILQSVLNKYTTNENQK